MTTKQFELGDSWQSQPAQASDTHYALLDDSIMSGSVEQIAARKGDKGQTARTADTQEGPATAAQKQFVEAAEAFDKSTDKKAALTQLGPKFEGAIKQADTDFDKTMTTVKTEARTLKPAYDAAIGKVQENQMKMVGAFQQVPEAEQQKVQALMQAYSLLDAKDPIRAAIEKGLTKYPGLIEGAKGMEAAMNNPAIKRVEELKALSQTALQDRVMTRMGYAEALQQGGDQDKSYKFTKEAADLLGIPMPEKRPLPKGMLEAKLQTA